MRGGPTLFSLNMEDAKGSRKDGQEHTILIRRQEQGQQLAGRAHRWHIQDIQESINNLPGSVYK